MVKNTGKDYEKFVQEIQQILLNADQRIDGKVITVERDKRLINHAGVSRQFDLYFEFEVGGHLFRTVIECKDYASAVSAEKIDAFLGKTSGIPGLNLIYATRTGYQSGAIAIARANAVRLLVVHHAEDEDWTDEDGNAFLRYISIRGTMNSATRLLSFGPIYDNDGLSEEQIAEIEHLVHAAHPDYYIDDIEKGECYNMLQLQIKLHDLYKDMHPGKGRHAQTLNNGWLVLNTGSFRTKLLGYEADFLKSLPVSIGMNIDLSDKLLGIVTDIIGGKKHRVWREEK